MGGIVKQSLKNTRYQFELGNEIKLWFGSWYQKYFNNQ